MRLDQLTLTNFRGFESLDITFDPQVTVLLGANMSGKTSVLAAVTIAFGDWMAGLARVDPTYDIEPPRLHASDVRRVLRDVDGVPTLEAQSPSHVDARGRLGETKIRTVRQPELQFMGEFAEHAMTLASAVKRGQVPNLPVIGMYGTHRLWQPAAPAELSVGIGSRLDGYVGCLDIGASQQQLTAWLKKQTLVQLQRGRGYAQPQLAGVEAAVCSALAVTRFWYDVEYDELRLERAPGDLQPFSMLSDGYRNMVAMVADIAWRAAVLNPQFGTEAHLKVEGVVMIDEVELHLHPGWQRRVLDDLLRTFPKVQFIVTTHSPQVVASVSRKQVRLLDNNRLVASDLFVEGRDTNELLEDVFGVPARPPEAQAEIDDLYRLIDAEDFVAARAKLTSLEQRLGPDDAQIVRARWILDSEDADRDPPVAAAR